MTITDWLSSLELLAIFCTAMGGAFTAVRYARLDLLGVLTLGVVTALGGGLMRDVLIGVTPPVAFTNLSYLFAALLGSAFPMFVHQPGKVLRRFVRVMDAVGLGLYSVVGAQKALIHGIEPLPAIIIGALSGVGGGAIRDVTVNRVPEVLRKGFYAVPAMAGSAFVAGCYALGLQNTPVPTLGGAILCFLLWALGRVLRIEVPKPGFVRDAPRRPPATEQAPGDADGPPVAPPPPLT